MGTSALENQGAKRMRQAEGREAATILSAGTSGRRRRSRCSGSNWASAAGATALRGGAEAEAVFRGCQRSVRVIATRIGSQVATGTVNGI